MNYVCLRVGNSGNEAVSFSCCMSKMDFHRDLKITMIGHQSLLILSERTILIVHVLFKLESVLQQQETVVFTSHSFPWKCGLAHWAKQLFSEWVAPVWILPMATCFQHTVQLLWLFSADLPLQSIHPAFSEEMQLFLVLLNFKTLLYKATINDWEEIRLQFMMKTQQFT